ncbi:putative nitrate ABC transporter, ATP-binding protein [Gordonia spumicola]|uniref:Putative nitrate ABC transporter, ATP-binding protein n=1 Tax=Gordonia spumicola TaxID=589161 RepID=A0A7I9VCL8_9ACTN|nr:ABC transporter ATP-binding protein [Gordonia spumicola]GEE03116.1 putative nitrate ABC transporter, ATP-binding protein [Gordonia spumicola]
MSTDIDIVDATLRHGDRTVVDRLSLSIPAGQILVVTGPSGCGKSTLLRAIAGLRPIDEGTISVGGHRVTGTSGDRAMVFQDDALHPWRTVRRNIALALGLRGVPRGERRAETDRWISEIGLDEFADHLPRELSGGMRQRVQLARGLAGAPRAVLMDEPFGALDAQTRTSMQQLLIRTLHAHPATVVFVTHDVDEAVLLGDRIVVLDHAGAGVRRIVDVPRPRVDSVENRAARDEAAAALVGGDQIREKVPA